MLFLQTTPPDTLNYMILGFVILFGTMGLHVASLILRRRSLEKDLALLEEFDTDDNES